MFWGLRLLAASPQAPIHTVGVTQGQSVRGDLARVLGGGPAATAVAAAPPPAAASRFKLVGVAAPKDGALSQGLALISFDGKPAKAIGVGRTVGDGWVLQSVHRRGARVATNLGAQTLDLELPALAIATRGALPPVGQPMPNPNGVPPSNGAGGMPQAGGARAVSPSFPPGMLVPGMPVPSAGSPPPVIVPPEDLQREGREAPPPPAPSN